MTHTLDEVAAAVADVVRTALTHGDDVHLPGLGTFFVEHQDSRLEERDGQMVMEPPRDIVAFSPED